MTNTVSKAEKERQKLVQERCQFYLTELLKDDDNKYCVDCDAKGKIKSLNIVLHNISDINLQDYLIKEVLEVIRDIYCNCRCLMSPERHLSSCQVLDGHLGTWESFFVFVAQASIATWEYTFPK